MTIGTGGIRTRLLFLSVAAAVLFAGTAVFFLVSHEALFRKAPHVKPLPLDADSLVKGFRFSHDFPGGSISITGATIVRRGQRFLSVRSTVLKTNFFENIAGVYRDGKNSVEFEARNGEWDLVLDKPLTLQGIRRLKINETALENLRTATIYFKQRLVKVYGETNQTYVLKE